MKSFETLWVWLRLDFFFHETWRLDILEVLYHRHFDGHPCLANSTEQLLGVIRRSDTQNILWLKLKDTCTKPCAHTSIASSKTLIQSSPNLTFPYSSFFRVVTKYVNLGNNFSFTVITACCWVSVLSSFAWLGFCVQSTLEKSWKVTPKDTVSFRWKVQMAATEQKLPMPENTSFRKAACPKSHTISFFIGLDLDLYVNRCGSEFWCGMFRERWLVRQKTVLQTHG